MAVTRAAFFDLDKTLVPGSSLFLLARGLYERDYYRAWDIARLAWGQFMFQVIGSESRAGMEKSRNAALEFVKGRYADELRSLGREIAEERVLPRVYGDIARVIDQHREAGDQTWLLTAAPQELAEMVARGLDMTGARGTVAAVDEQGRYTGELVGEIAHGPAKAKIAEEIAGSHGIEMRDSAAYSDSINDLPLLESVGHPHAVNPDHSLRRIARARGWPIHELRTRRRALLIGVPSTVGGAALFSAGVAVGAWLARRRHGRAGGWNLSLHSSKRTR
jgi:HAD superfamily hydrolase (TIGR01490 family)